MNATITSILVVIAASLFGGSQVVSGLPGDPILIVPGISGAQLDVKHSGYTLCNTLGQSVGLWVSDVRFLKFGCFSSEMTLKFDKTTGQFSSSDDNVNVTVPGFGDTDTVEQLGQGLVLDIPYFKEFVDYFVARGYERGKSIRGAPYDWRLAPVELQRRGYYDNLKQLVETMYKENGDTKVTIAAHSMGAPITLYFLTSGLVSQTWKDTYIGNFITLAGAWSGGNEALQVHLSGLTIVNSRPGDMFNVFRYLGDQIRVSLKPIMRSHQSISFLYPRPSVWGDTVLVTTPTRKYTAKDYEDLFSDIEHTDGYAKYQGIESINENFPAPNVPTHCFYGVGVETPLSFRYSQSFPEGAEDDPEVIMGDGDGTVNILSSEVCLRWANSGSYFKPMTFDGASHQGILSSEDVLKQVERIVGAQLNPSWLSISKTL